jgi:hypothetical protein
VLALKRDRQSLSCGPTVDPYFPPYSQGGKNSEGCAQSQHEDLESDSRGLVEGALRVREPRKMDPEGVAGAMVSVAGGGTSAGVGG